ncbi:ATP-grasp domain-containing protein [Vibrio vulnificus]|uniref:ATP-grasp domain-containing protein n=1 Tax=Vibrio vulnificus TaxID=672 RepID=UPI001EECEAFD|nr:ATP-grasp domain-containing protein [Vibrio vulnificus]
MKKKLFVLDLKPFDLYLEYLKSSDEMGFNLIQITEDSKVYKDFTDHGLESNVIRLEEISPKSVLEAIIDDNKCMDTIFTESERCIDIVREIYNDSRYLGAELLSELTPRSKNLMRELFKEKGINQANWFKVSSEKNINYSEVSKNFNFPLIIKPESGFSSFGVKKCLDIDSLAKQAKRIDLYNMLVLKEFSKSGNGIIVEEFITGKEYSVDTYWINGVPIQSFILTRGEQQEDTFPDDLYYYDPKLAPEIEEAILDISCQIGHCFNVKDGVTHSEVIVTKENQVFAIESSPRGGAGGMFNKLFSAVSCENTFKLRLLPLVSQKENVEFKSKLSDEYYFFIQPQIERSGKFAAVPANLRDKFLDITCFLRPGEKWNGSKNEINYFIWALGSCKKFQEIIEYKNFLEQNEELME